MRCLRWMAGVTLLALIAVPAAAQNASLGDWLWQQGCRQALHLVGPGNALQELRTTWNPSAPLSPSNFLADFQQRYGISYADRRAPREVETAVTVQTEAAALIQKNPALFGLPAGYRVSYQDTADLQFVAGPRGGTVAREIFEPLLQAEVGTPGAPVVPTCIPCNCPTCPACAEKTCAPAPALSDRGRELAARLQKWRAGTFLGGGRLQDLQELLAEVLAKLGSAPSPPSTGRTTVGLVPE